MFRGPSWTDLSCVPLCASSPKTFSAASRLRKISSSGASYRLASHPLRRAFASPAGGDRTFGHLPLHSPLPVRGCRASAREVCFSAGVTKLVDRRSAWNRTRKARKGGTKRQVTKEPISAGRQGQGSSEPKRASRENGAGRADLPQARRGTHCERNESRSRRPQGMC
jgi:hypothetical protein